MKSPKQKATSVQPFPFWVFGRPCLLPKHPQQTVALAGARVLLEGHQKSEREADWHLDLQARLLCLVTGPKTTTLFKKCSASHENRACRNPTAGVRLKPDVWGLCVEEPFCRVGESGMEGAKGACSSQRHNPHPYPPVLPVLPLLSTHPLSPLLAALLSPLRAALQYFLPKPF